jgi:alpha-glucoside transport system permease protein
MSGSVGKRAPLVLAVHLSVLFLVVVWTIPTIGLFVSSIRDKDQLATSGWWTALSTSEQNLVGRTVEPNQQVERDGRFILSGNVLDGQTGKVVAFGWRSQEPTAFEPGTVAEMRDGETMTVAETGDYAVSSPVEWSGNRGPRIFYTAAIPPRFTLDNYREVLTAEGIGRSFINSLTVAVPATMIPIMIAAFAAYALAWMEFPGRALLIAAIIGLLVVPLQMSLIPLLKFYNSVGAFFGVGAKTYLGIWLAHTGFGLPLAIYLLRNYIVGLPREIMDSARVDGASDYEIFMRIVLPLSFPAIASFAICHEVFLHIETLGQARSFVAARTHHPGAALPDGLGVIPDRGGVVIPQRLLIRGDLELGLEKSEAPFDMAAHLAAHEAATLAAHHAVLAHHPVLAHHAVTHLAAA